MTKHIYVLELMLGFLLQSQEKYDVYDHEKQRKPPQHDFSTPEVQITPSSFRFMTGHQEIIDGKLHLVNDKDHTIVTVRPKYYTGSSGSIWASETMFLRRELPQLFEVSEGPAIQIQCTCS